MELYAERGFEQTTVAEIAKRAGLTERTFFRYFADKREVLFAGSSHLEDLLVRAIAEAPESAAPIDAGVVAVDAAVAAVPVDAAAAPVTCRLEIATTPTGAALTLDRTSLGNAPFSGEVPCGAATLVARLPQFSTSTRQLKLVAGKPQKVAVKLARPVHDITILSTPIHAVVKIDGRKVGFTPLSTTIAAFGSHTVTLELEGYQVYRKVVQTDVPEQTVAAPLVPLP